MYVHWSVVNKRFKLSLNLWIMHLLTCWSFNFQKISEWASDKYLERFDVLPPMVSSFTFIICFVWKVTTYFTLTVLFFIHFECWWFDPSCSYFVMFTSCAAIWEALRNSSVWNTEMSKIMRSYRFKYNRYNIFSVPVYRASLPTNKKILPYGKQHPLPLLGKLTTGVSAHGRTTEATFYVVQGNHGSLLRHATASELGLIHVVHSADIQPSLSVADQLMLKYPNITKGIG